MQDFMSQHEEYNYGFTIEDDSEGELYSTDNERLLKRISQTLLGCCKVTDVIDSFDFLITIINDYMPADERKVKNFIRRLQDEMVQVQIHLYGGHAFLWSLNEKKAKKGQKVKEELKKAESQKEIRKPKVKNDRHECFFSQARTSHLFIKPCTKWIHPNPF